jgi:hypothetical protein
MENFLYFGVVNCNLIDMAIETGNQAVEKP